jgi:hypothetical protein
VNGVTNETTYHVGKEFQKVITASTDYRHYIYLGNRSVAVYSRLSTGTSIVKENFSAFGNRRNPATWSGAPSAADLTAINNITREGYTWLTALGAVGLNQMTKTAPPFLNRR